MSPAKKKSGTKKKSAKKSAKKSSSPAKVGWADAMQQALEKKKTPGGGWPDQPKPRDSGIQKVRKNAF